MNKLSRLIIAALVGVSFSLPVFAQEAKSPAKSDAKTIQAAKKGSTATNKAAKMSATNAAAPAKGKSHKMHAAKKGATEGKKEGQTAAPKTATQPKGAAQSAPVAGKPATGVRKHGPVMSQTKVKGTAKKADKTQKVKS